MMQVPIKRYCLRDNPFHAIQGVSPPVPGKSRKWGKLTHKLEKFDGNAFFWKSCLKTGKTHAYHYGPEQSRAAFRLLKIVSKHCFQAQVFNLEIAWVFSYSSLNLKNFQQKCTLDTVWVLCKFGSTV